MVVVNPRACCAAMDVIRDALQRAAVRTAGARFIDITLMRDSLLGKANSQTLDAAIQLLDIDAQHPACRGFVELRATQRLRDRATLDVDQVKIVAGMGVDV